ncbi:MAG: hypothetical protein EPN60_09715 [Nevskiaceae bacterium]|nr:MAG: hypothetical protein EPN60_09715 [Nevskiaceae bacterium]
MNNVTRITLAAALLALTQGAFAHDPAEHAKEAADAKKGANCESMKGMDMSKMDPNDPVMKAMMAKCAGRPKTAEQKGMEGMDHSKMPMPATAPKKADSHGGH